MKTIVHVSPGIVLAVLIAVASVYLGHLVPLLGAPLFGILLGALVGNLVGIPERAEPGSRFAAKRILQWSIILIGASLSLREVFSVGSSSFAVMIATLATAFVASVLIGRGLGIPPRLTVLIGAGTGICGGSAIAAVSPIIKAEEMEIAYAMSTIFLFNVVAVLVFPTVGHLLGFSAKSFGLWAGTAINDTSSVVAAGYAYGNAAGNYATIVKLTRTTMIVPVSLGLAVMMAMRLRRPSPAAALTTVGATPAAVPAASPAGSASPPAAAADPLTATADPLKPSPDPFSPSADPKRMEQTDGVAAPEGKRGAEILRVFPWFILGFLATSLVNTLHLAPAALLRDASEAGRFLVVVALAAVGLNARLTQMLRAGFRPIVLGLGVWASVAISSLLIQKLT